VEQPGEHLATQSILGDPELTFYRSDICQRNLRWTQYRRRNSATAYCHFRW
jgi:hypothetical protein